MYYPLYYTTNFFDNPDEIRQWAMSLEFTKPEDGLYPGARTKLLHELDTNFFDFVHLKIMSLVYGKETKYVSWETKSYFQLIKYEDIKEDNSGWIHTDNTSALTSIIYLTPGKTNTGTSLYKPKKAGFQPDKGDTYLKLVSDETLNYYKSGKASEDYKNKQLTFNNNFQKLVSVNSEYNSMVAFDGGYYHSADWDLKPGEERLTFITFFNRINAPWYSIPEMRRDCKK
tara:strand:+ start:188 stop:871 length:684 start_codon:yes stop_codon:yes gene_type:complete